MAVGLLNSAHSIGGIIGLFGWVIIAELIGWKQSLLLSGGFGLISSLLLITFLPRKEEAQPEQNTVGKHLQLKIADIRSVLLDKSLFLTGLVLLGAQIAWGLSLTFSIFYLEDYLKVNSVTAGFITSLNLVCGLVSAPIFGKLYDKVRNIKKLLFVCGVAMSAGLACNALTITSSSSEYVVVMSNILVGVFSAGVFTIAYTSAKEVSMNTRAEMKNKENIETTLMKRSNGRHVLL